MVKAGGVALCILVVAMDIGAGILGIQAEVAQHKERHLRLWVLECRDPSPNAFRLGLAAAGFLCLGHVLANFLGGCLCACSPYEFQRSQLSRQLATICLVFTWISFAVGLGALVVGMMWNNKSRGACGFADHHFLSIGGIACFVHALFVVGYYVSASAEDEPKDSASYSY